MGEEEKRKPPPSPSLYRETRLPDYSPPPASIGVKRRGSGVAYMVLGLVFGAIGVSRVITLIPAAWEIITGSGSEASTTLQDSRMQVAIGIVAGLVGVICAEVGTRRETGKILWLGMVASVLGIFAVLVGAGLAVLLFTQGT